MQSTCLDMPQALITFGFKYSGLLLFEAGQITIAVRGESLSIPTVQTAQAIKSTELSLRVFSTILRAILAKTLHKKTTKSGLWSTSLITNAQNWLHSAALEVHIFFEGWQV